MTTQTKPTIGILITSLREHGYIHFRAYHVLLDSEKPGSVRNICDSSWGDGDAGMFNGLYMPDLVIDSQGDCERGRERKLYGFDLYYQPSRVHANHAKRMAKTLTTIGRRLDKLSETRGYVKAFGEYVGRIAEATGVTVILRYPYGWDRNRGYTTMHSEIEYVRLNLGDGIRAIDGMVREWTEEDGAQAVAS